MMSILIAFLVYEPLFLPLVESSHPPLDDVVVLDHHEIAQEHQQHDSVLMLNWSLLDIVVQLPLTNVHYRHFSQLHQPVV